MVRSRILKDAGSTKISLEAGGRSGKVVLREAGENGAIYRSKRGSAVACRRKLYMVELALLLSVRSPATNDVGDFSWLPSR